MKTAICKVLGTLLLTASAVANAQLEYVTNADGVSVTVTGYSGSVPTTLAIPKAHGGLTVTGIADEAFASSYNLRTVTIPDTVTSLGNYVFENSGLTIISIPNSITNIPQGAFVDCGSLTNASIPDSVVSIGSIAFNGCGLTSVTIPGSVKDMGEGAFAGCPLTNVTIGYGVGTIQTNAFGSCNSLTNVTIPATVTNIDDSAFKQCVRLTNVFFTGNAPFADNTSFQDFMGDGRGGDTNYYAATAYYLPGTTGWAEFSSNAMIPAVLWNPVIQATGASFGVQSNQFGFDITGTTNIPIVVEAATNLAQPIWAPLQSMTLTNGLVHFSEPIETNTAARFYRIGAPGA